MRMTEPGDTTAHDPSFPYLFGRVDDQIRYFDRGAVVNQRNYRIIKTMAILCNVLTTMTIALAFMLPESYRTILSIGALILSTLVLATYQWEEFYNYGARWEKFRLVAEQLRSERWMFLNKVGRYDIADDEARKKAFVQTVEQIIRGTDISYFALMVEPGRRIERRLETLGARSGEDYRASS